MSGTRTISTTSRCQLSSSFFLQGKALKEIRTILIETLACFHPGQAKDLTAPLYVQREDAHFCMTASHKWHLLLELQITVPTAAKQFSNSAFRKWCTETTCFNHAAEGKLPTFCSPTLSDSPECPQIHLLIKCYKSNTHCTTRSLVRFAKHLILHT